MKKWIVAVVGLCSLACSGLAEKAMEASGTSMEVSESGEVTMSLPNGQRLVTRQGGPAPDGFPLPPPWDGATIESVTLLTEPGGRQTNTVVYRLDSRSSEEILAVYESWLDSAGTRMEASSDAQMPGMSTDTLMGTLDSGDAIAVSLSDVLAQRTLALVHIRKASAGTAEPSSSDEEDAEADSVEDVVLVPEQDAP